MKAGLNSFHFARKKKKLKKKKPRPLLTAAAGSVTGGTEGCERTGEGGVQRFANFVSALGEARL